MQLWSAFLLGLLGSLHCAGMCGPLALALPPTGNTRVSFVGGRLAYNAGRILTYSFLGALFGAVGMTFALAGFQRGASIAAGLAILIGLLASTRYAIKTPLSKAINLLRIGLGKLMRRKSYGSIFLLGFLNGFLPCGLVYAACAGAIAAGGMVSSVEYMLVFGVGTVPMMFSIGVFGHLFRLGFRFQRLIPAFLAVMGFLLVLRGLSLGIPYVSPVMSSYQVHCSACR
jgi:sulfite exporter TauE/SafE